jgi:gliding motility-associated-like protein
MRSITLLNCIISLNVIALFTFMPIHTAAQIKVLNVGDAGSARGIQNVYNLFGDFLIDNALPKLLNPDLFGINGVVKDALEVKNDFNEYNSIIDSTLIQDYDIIFIGSYADGDGAFSTDELNLLQKWSQQPGKVLLVMEQAIGYPLTRAMGYNLIETFANPTVATADDAGFTNIFTGGPFGNASNIDQAGGSQGSFDLACGSKVLGINIESKPAIVFDPYYRDILCADIGYFTNQTGQMELDNTANTDVEKAWCNLWAWAIKEVKAKTMPVILPPSSQPLGTAVWNGPGALPLCGINTGGSVNVTDTVKGFYFLGWQTSTDGGINWQDIATITPTLSFTNPANGTMFRFVSGTDISRSTSCKLYFSNPLTVTVNSYQEKNQYYEMCEGSSYMGHSVAGIYRDTTVEAGACTINTLHLTVSPKRDSIFSVTICAGNSYEGYSKAGTYKDKFKASNGCDSIRTVTLIVNQKQFSTISQTICEGETYLGRNSTGTYVDTLVAANGCDSIRTLKLVVRSRSYSTIIQSICPGQEYLGYRSNGVFVDTLTATNGCDSIRTLHLTVKPANVSAVSHTICKGESYLGYNSAGVYTDTLVAANGCDSVRILTLKVNGLPQPYLGADTLLCIGDSVKLNPGIYQSYLWANGNTTATLTVKREGSYNVTVTNQCGSASTSRKILFSECQIYFPNAFTPNGDGNNDVFKVLNGLNIVTFNLTIFNRWGQKVFQTTQPTQGWDGKSNGQTNTPGVYIWSCNLTERGKQLKTLHGTVTLVR